MKKYKKYLYYKFNNMEFYGIIQYIKTTDPRYDNDTFLLEGKSMFIKYQLGWLREKNSQNNDITRFNISQLKIIKEYDTLNEVLVDIPELIML